jgi:hypothetical protein
VKMPTLNQESLEDRGFPWPLPLGNIVVVLGAGGSSPLAHPPEIPGQKARPERWPGLPVFRCPILGADREPILFVGSRHDASSVSRTTSHHLVPAMSLSRSNIADVIRQPSLLRTSSTTAPPRATTSDGRITLNAMSDVTTTDGRLASTPSC